MAGMLRLFFAHSTYTLFVLRSIGEAGSAAEGDGVCLKLMIDYSLLIICLSSYSKSNTGEV